MLPFLLAAVIAGSPCRAAGPVAVSEGLGNCQSPRTACGPDGAVHVIWRNDVTGIWEIYFRSFTGGTATPVLQLSSLNRNALSPVLACGPDGTLHAAWSAEINGTYDILYTASDSTGTFPRPLNISGDARSSTEPALLVAADGIHMAWRNNTGDGDDIYTRTCAAGRWSAVTDLSRLTGVSCSPAVAGGPCVVWSDDSYGSWNVYLRMFRNGKWRGRTDVYTGHYDGTFPAACGSGDTLHLAWVQTDGAGADVTYRRLTGGSWSTAANLSRSGMVAGAPRLAADGRGRVHAVWAESTPDGNVLYWRCLAGGIWSDPVRFGNGTADPDFPDVTAAPDGSAWAVWRARDGGRRHIFMQHLTVEDIHGKRE